MPNRFSVYDNLLDGFSFKNLITAVVSNEQNINEESIKKVFNEILKAQLYDAEYLLKTEMKNIIKICKSNEN